MDVYNQFANFFIQLSFQFHYLKCFSRKRRMRFCQYNLLHHKEKYKRGKQKKIIFVQFAQSGKDAVSPGLAKRRASDVLQLPEACFFQLFSGAEAFV